MINVRKMKWDHFFDIKYLILFFFLIRLFGITNPPIEVSHSWRQSTTAMYARNFSEIDNNILYARVDMAGDLSGITAKEFPLFNYLIYLSGEVFGFQEWHGRLINLLVSSFGVYFFFLLVAKYVNRRTANYATLILLCSIWFGHGRKIMPDCFAMSLALMAIWYGLEYLYSGKRVHLVLYFIIGLLGTLSKLPVIYSFVIFLIPFFQKTIPISRKMGFAVGSSVILIANSIWYFYWIPFIVETYGFEHYPMRQFWEGAIELLGDLPETAERFYISAMKSYVAFGLYCIGVVLIFWKKHRLLVPVFGLLSLIFILFMFKSGATFYHHNYYIIPFVPIMSLLAAFAVTQVSYKWLRVVLLLAIVGEGVGNQQDGFRIKERDVHKLELESLLNQYTDKSDLIAINSHDRNPQEMYLAHRKGWMLLNEEVTDARIQQLEEKGCQFLLINRKKWHGGPLPNRKKVLDTDHYWGYELEVEE